MNNLFNQDEPTPEPEELDPAAAFQRMTGQLGLLTAAVEGFAARQVRIEARDYSEELGRLIEAQRGVHDVIKELAKRPAMTLTPEAFAESVDRASKTARIEDRELLAQARGSISEAATAMANTVGRVRTSKQQRDALIWAAVVSMVLTILLAVILPIVRQRLWPASNEARAAALLRQSPWNAGVQLLRDADPARFQSLAEANNLLVANAEALGGCQRRASVTGRPVRCQVTVSPESREQH